MIFGKILMMWDASQFMEGEILVNCGDFICVTCILCVSKLGNFKLHLGHTFG